MLTSVSVGWLTAFLLGFSGSFAHCAAMCGPIALAIHKPRSGSTSLTARTGAYHVGRIATYTGIGVAAGAIGSLVDFASAGLRLVQEGAAVLGGLLLVWAGLSLLLKGRGGFENWFGANRLFQRAGRLMRQQDLVSGLLLGLLLGFLPCGLVYSAASYALASGSPWQGGGFMLAFGLGTVPALVASAYVAGALRKHGRFFTWASGCLLIASGLAYLWKGFPG